jgi:hypothetical protein
MNPSAINRSGVGRKAVDHKRRAGRQNADLHVRLIRCAVMNDDPLARNDRFPKLFGQFPLGRFPVAARRNQQRDGYIRVSAPQLAKHGGQDVPAGTGRVWSETIRVQVRLPFASSYRRLLPMGRAIAS